MLRSIDVVDVLPGGALLARWQIIDGQPRCWAGPYPIADTAPDLLDAQRVENATVRVRMAAVELYEEAQRVVARGPAVEGYDAALATISGANDLTRAYAVVRAVRPEEPGPDSDPTPEWTAFQQAVAIIDAAG